MAEVGSGTVYGSFIGNINSCDSIDSVDLSFYGSLITNVYTEDLNDVPLQKLLFRYENDYDIGTDITFYESDYIKIYQNGSEVTYDFPIHLNANTDYYFDVKILYNENSTSNMQIDLVNDLDGFTVNLVITLIQCKTDEPEPESEPEPEPEINIDFIFNKVFDITDKDNNNISNHFQPLHNLTYKCLLDFEQYFEDYDEFYFKWYVSYVPELVEHIEDNVLRNITRALVLGLKYYSNLNFSMPEDANQNNLLYQEYEMELNKLKTQYSTNNIIMELQEENFKPLI